jgi:cytolysin-activating lysine-acyltransferase
MQKSQQTSHVNRNFVGDVLSIVALSDFHHHWKMHKVKRVFVPPLQIGQFRIWYQDSRPTGFCSWAWVSDEILNKLQKENYLMQPQDWKSGSNLWFAEFVAPYGNARQMVKDMRRFILNQYGENIKGHWFRPTKKKQGSAVSGKKAA